MSGPRFVGIAWIRLPANQPAKETHSHIFPSAGATISTKYPLTKLPSERKFPNNSTIIALPRHTWEWRWYGKCPKYSFLLITIVQLLLLLPLGTPKQYSPVHWYAVSFNGHQPCICRIKVWFIHSCSFGGALFVLFSVFVGLGRTTHTDSLIK